MGKASLIMLLLIALSMLLFTGLGGKFIDVLSGNAPQQDPCINGCIRVASWNIENFGQKKASDNATMERIAEIIGKYDIVAIQEVSNLYEMSDTGCPRNQRKCPSNQNCGLILRSLETSLNQRLGLNYSFLISPQIKDERYMFVFKNDKVRLNYVKVADDPKDTKPACDLHQTGVMARQPFVANFNAGDFTFTLITAHTDPDINVMELEGLAEIYNGIASEESNAIILGDLNADCSYLSKADKINLRGNEYTWVVDDDADTTVSNSVCAYDRFIMKDDARQYYSGRWGIDRNVTEKMSDHYLIWADFRIG